MNCPSTKHARHSGRSRLLVTDSVTGGSSGFALVISLSLMAFVLLILLAFVSLAQVESASANQSKQMMAARQNAYLGLMVAMGELQKSAGPDQRITARADILTGDTGISVDAMENPYWMGVWDTTEADWDTLTAEEKMSRASWMVSGNQGLEPADEAVQAPNDELETSIEMASSNSEFDVKAVTVPPSLLSDGSGGVAGRFGYWISGENSKALVSISDPYASSDEANANVREQEQLRSFLVPQRTGVEALDSLANYPVNDDSLERVFALSSQMSDWLSDGSIDAGDFTSVRSHDLTTWSKGLLVDVKDGALKRDLTQAFEVLDSFELHFPDTVFKSQALSDVAAADPMTPEPYYFVGDKLIADQIANWSGPNWEIFRDYYQQYWPASDTSRIKDDYIHFRLAKRKLPGKNEQPVFTSHWEGSTKRHSDPYISSGMPYQYTSDTSFTAGDNYQASSLATPLISQLRISYALGLVDPEDGGTQVPVIVFKPVLSLYNPYNTRLAGSDFRTVVTLNPKITLTLHLHGGSVDVEFYLMELQDANNQGFHLLAMADSTIGPGEILHHSFDGFSFAKTRKSKYKTNNLSVKWDVVGGLYFPLSKVSDEFYPNPAGVAGAISVEQAKKDRGDNEYGWHPQWGLTTNTDDVNDEGDLEPGKPGEQEFLLEAVRDGVQVDLKIEYEDFGAIRSYTNSTAAGQTYNKIVDVWEQGSGNQPETYETSFQNFQDAAKQDSFGTLVVNLRTTERQGGEETDALRNLVDLNMRALHINSAWDGDNGSSRYLSLYEVEALGQNDVPPEYVPGLDSDVRYGYWGRKNNKTNGGQRSVVLFDRPREPLLSLGQLQHANLGRYHFDPTYIAGTSYANVRIPLEKERFRGFDDQGFDGVENLTYFDLPYLVNQQLWDGFFFSSIEMPYTEESRDILREALAKDDSEEGSKALADVVLNPRLEFVASAEEDIDRYNRIALYDTADDDFENAIYRPASEMWVNGAFNVNSTSVQAWKAVLSSTSNLEIPISDYMEDPARLLTENDAIYSRMYYPYFEGFNKGDASTNDRFWNGYRRLSSSEVDKLAESIVSLIKERGPFLSLASFVNRKLEDSEAGKKGLLQAALDGTSTLDGVNSNLPSGVSGEPVVAFDYISNFFVDNLSSGDHSSMGFPGYLLQSDLLQHLAPILTVRSDTFTIRSYGDVVNPVTNQVTGRVWCEAKVQRVPSPVKNDEVAVDADPMDEWIQPSSSFGRQFKIISFTWLDPEQI